MKDYIIGLKTTNSKELVNWMIGFDTRTKDSMYVSNQQIHCIADKNLIMYHFSTIWDFPMYIVSMFMFALGIFFSSWILYCSAVFFMFLTYTQSNLFFYQMMYFGLKKAGHKHKMQYVTQREIASILYEVHYGSIRDAKIFV